MQLNFIKRYILLVGIAWPVICATVSVSFLLLSGLWLENLAAVMLFMLLWLAGLTAVVLLGRKLYLQTSAVFESERQRDQAEMSLDFLSNYDRSTNLPNRYKFEEQLEELFGNFTDEKGKVCVTALEFRNYKQIINNLEFPVGDALFKIMAERLAVILTDEDTVARYGEDRLLFSYTSFNQQPDIEVIMQGFIDEVGRPLVLEGHKFFPEVYLGSAVFPVDAEDARPLVQ